MRPITTFVRHNSIKAMLAAEHGLKAVSNGKLGKNLFDVEPKFIGTDVRIIKETDDSTFIAKCDTSGRIVNKPFKILVTTDLHLCDDYELINKSLSMLAKHVEAERPDLILFTGDIVLTDHQQVDCVQFGRFMEKMGIYWAYVFGNHEARAEKEYHKYFMLKNLISFPHCLSKFGDPSLFGYGNFFINILSSPTSIQQSIVMLDSGRNTSPTHNIENGAPAELKCYDFLKKDQIDWYRKNIISLESEYGKFKSIWLCTSLFANMKMSCSLTETASMFRPAKRKFFTAECMNQSAAPNSTAECSTLSRSLAVLKPLSSATTMSTISVLNMTVFTLSMLSATATILIQWVQISAGMKRTGCKA